MVGWGLEPLVALPLGLMAPPDDLFLHKSRLHGQSHVSRVMVLATLPVNRLGLSTQKTRLWASVCLHDIARPHDGVCFQHSARAVQRQGRALLR